ncbi:MAG: hypothetical protein L0Y56_01995 [Nitrospira sp.]|nr:hypothetical protein [Nitrospira sp.]
METTSTIFIVSNYIMFSYGLESLLSQQADLKIIGQETDPVQAIKRIEQTQPDVVIIYADASPPGSTPIVIDILKVNSKAKVIGLNVQNNIFYVYQATQWVVTRWEDLLKAIQDQDTPPC